MKVASAVYIKNTFGNRAREVLKRMYIWHKQKATKAERDNERDDLARHNGYMSLIAIEQKALAQL